jgi:molecular chaperone GrpE
MSGPKKEDNVSPFSGLLSDPMPEAADNDEGANGNEIAREAAQIAALHAEVAELKDRYLRAVAETENVRRRAEREKTDSAQFAFGRFAKDLLNVLDNFSRALDVINPEQRAELPAGAASVIEGIEAIQREMVSIFERHGIKRVQAKGQRFDPNLHQAIAEIPTGDQPPGTVIDVAQEGYMIGGRLLREAMVTVAKKAPGAQSGKNGKPSGSSVDTNA